MGLKGMPDILPAEASGWQFMETSARGVLHNYGYREIRTPILEEAGLFQRSIGEETDIVQKQMYSFKDRGERAIALRPEGTAPVVRAYLEHNLGIDETVNRLYYMGPMFRSEKPQVGRNRQFYQIGAELIGSAGPYADAEIISLAMGILGSCGLSDAKLEINSLGCPRDKKSFEQALKNALKPELSRLCKECNQRYEKNVLRIFDCKNEACRRVVAGAPKVTDHICPDCGSHFDKVKEALDSVGIKYSLNKLLVRGLDYYTGTVFEITHDKLGSQDAVAAGGRYDNLIEELGGQKTPACGFAIGMDRAAIASKGALNLSEGRIELFLVLLGEAAQKEGFKILNELLSKGISCQMGLDAKSLKSQMRLADKIKAKNVLIIGDDEIKKGKAILRDMDKKEQKEVSLKDVADTYLR